MLVLLILLFLIAAYFYATKNHNYWAKKNVRHDKPLPLFGNHLRNVFGIRSIIEISTELYNKHPGEQVVGYYRGRTPELIVRDLDVAKYILISDFSSFYPRGCGFNLEIDPLLRNLFHADGDLWKLLRQRSTAAFTTARLKGMFPLVVRCAGRLQALCEDIVTNGGECDVRDLMARFTTEFIGACGFGLHLDTINNERSMFRELGKHLFKHDWKRKIVVGIWEIFPEIRRAVKVLNKRFDETLYTIVRNICEQKNFKPSGHGDFVDLLLELQNEGVIRGDSIEHRNPDGSPMQIEMEMDFQCLVAQVFIFFTAGFETSSSVTSFLLHQLAFHPDIQHKIQIEIDGVLKKYGDELCYDSVAEMSMLRNSFREAMRMFPSVGVLHRVCAKKCTIPGLGLTIDAGVRIQVPLQAIHNDEKYFEAPTEFRPERFSEAQTDRHSFAYLPFGSGPRACIGARLGEMQSLAGLAAVLHKFSVRPSNDTKRIPETDHSSNIVQGIKGGLPLKLEIRKN